MIRRLTGKKIGVAGCAIILLLATIYIISDDLKGWLLPTPERGPAGKPTIAEHQRPLSGGQKQAPMQAPSAADGQGTVDILNLPDVGTRVQAVLALRMRTDPKGVQMLSEFLEDPNDTVVSEAIDALGFIGMNSDQKEAIFSLLAEKAYDKSFNMRGNALVVAAMLGERPQVVSLISKFVEEDYEGSDAAAIRAMTFALDPGLTPHIEKLVERNDNLELQRAAFNHLARINTAKSTELLERYLTSDDPQTQTGAVWALSRQNDAAHNLILTEAVAGRTLQRGAIGEIAQSPAASAVFGDLLSRETIDDQQKIDLLKIVAAETQHAPGEVRNSMADVAAALLYSPNEEVQRQALETLGTVAAMKDLTDAIEPKLESSNFTIQKAALDAFIQYLTPSSYEPLKKLWYHEDEKMRRTAFFFSEPFLGQRDVPDLQKAAQHSDQFISKHSAMMLQYLKTD